MLEILAKLCNPIYLIQINLRHIPIWTLVLLNIMFFISAGCFLLGSKVGNCLQPHLWYCNEYFLMGWIGLFTGFIFNAITTLIALIKEAKENLNDIPL